jgi:hypothetical protein
MRLAASIAFVLVSLSGERVFAADFIGAEKCGACHQAEYQQWLTTGHATALARLPKPKQADATCRSCHTMSPANDDPQLAGVQCESCHGPGKFYAPRFVMKDPELAKLLSLQAVTEDQCAPCHAKDTPSVRDFKFEDAIALVRHKPPKGKKSK